MRVEKTGDGFVLHLDVILHLRALPDLLRREPLRLQRVADAPGRADPRLAHPHDDEPLLGERLAGFETHGTVVSAHEGQALEARRAEERRRPAPYIQGLDLDLTLAGLGSRMIAAVVDAVLIGLLVFLLLFGVSQLALDGLGNGIVIQAAVTIVGERERQTLELLQVSQMSAWGIVVGKLLSSIAFVLLLLVASTPLLVIPVLLGGVTIADVIGGVGMVMAAAVMIGAVSMWTSARAKSTQGAVLGSYVWTVALVIGTLALVVAELLVTRIMLLDRFAELRSNLVVALRKPA